MKQAGRTAYPNQRGVTPLAVLLLLVVILGAALIMLTYTRWEGRAPQLTFDHDFKALGRHPALNLKVEDAETGIHRLSVQLRQKDQQATLVDEKLPGPSVFRFWASGSIKVRQIDLGTLISTNFKAQEGPATLAITVSDHSLRNFFRGNRVELQKEFVFDLYPPRLEVLSSQHYINQGGSECVVYKVSPNAEVSGVQAGPYFFPGFVVGTADPGLRFSLFAFAYNIPTDSALKVIARDAAGNEAVAGFWNKLFPKKFRSRDIQLEDGFLQKVVPEIVSRTPNVRDQGDLLRTFLDINSNLRKANHQFIAELSKKSPPRFLWNGPFLQLSNSQVESLFADHRTYIYQGKEVDRQDHVGFDLSVTQQYPIEAANDGVVAHADYFGIYGNAVILDHGCGLLSLYGHMSSINVKVGQEVKKKDVLGRSGATGLAGGDHLHFGMFLQGVPINPTEWWDGKWIKEHVLDRLNLKQ
jgi:murein DD-endopeptidase MepM/ murein hydrolase activator NlpD